MFLTKKTWFKIRTSGSSSVDTHIIYLPAIKRVISFYIFFRLLFHLFSSQKNIYCTIQLLHPFMPLKKKYAKRHHRGVGGFQVTQKKVWLNDWGTKSTMTLPAFMDATASLVISNGEGLVAEIRFVHGFFCFFWHWQLMMTIGFPEFLAKQIFQKMVAGGEPHHILPTRFQMCSYKKKHKIWATHPQTTGTPKINIKAKVCCSFKVHHQPTLSATFHPSSREIIPTYQEWQRC